MAGIPTNPANAEIEQLWTSLDQSNGSHQFSSTEAVNKLSNPAVQELIHDGNGISYSATRNGRRSWFDQPPATTFELAMEKPQQLKAKKQLDNESEMETLLLTHFTNPPRIDFGKGRPDMIRTRKLLIRNPHEYNQQVKVEKYPLKKKFTVDPIEFIVPAEGCEVLTITWSPEEEGHVREMLLFLVDKSYRVQAFVFGTTEKPPQQKKRRGVLGTRVKKPFSVVYTQNLANIKDSYTPRKSPTDTVVLLSYTNNKSKARLDNVVPGKQKRRSGAKRWSGKQRSPIHDIENIPPVSAFTSEEQTPVSERRELSKVCHDVSDRLQVYTPQDQATVQSAKKKSIHRRSVTYTKLLDTPIQVSNCQQTPQLTKQEMFVKSPCLHKLKLAYDTSPETETQAGVQLASMSVMRSPELENPADIFQTLSSSYSSSVCSSSIKPGETVVKENYHKPALNMTELDISLISPGALFSQFTDKVPVTPVGTAPQSAKNQSFYRTPAMHPQPMLLSDRDMVSAMVLQTIENKHHGSEGDSLFPDDTTDLSALTKAQPIVNSTMNTDKTFISPETFLKEAKSRASNAHALDDLPLNKQPSPSLIFNNSIPHEVILQQLESVRTSLHHRKSLGSAGKVLSPPSKSFVEPLSKKRTKSASLSLKKKQVPIHLKRGAKKELFVKIPDAPSPRRGTFVVSKAKQTPNKFKTSPGRFRSTPSSIKKIGSHVMGRMRAAVTGSRTKVSPELQYNMACEENHDGNKKKKQKIVEEPEPAGHCASIPAVYFPDANDIARDSDVQGVPTLNLLRADQTEQCTTLSRLTMVVQKPRLIQVDSGSEELGPLSVASQQPLDSVHILASRSSSFTTAGQICSATVTKTKPSCGDRDERRTSTPTSYDKQDDESSLVLQSPVRNKSHRRHRYTLDSPEELCVSPCLLKATEDTIRVLESFQATPAINKNIDRTFAINTGVLPTWHSVEGVDSRICHLSTIAPDIAAQTACLLPLGNTTDQHQQSDTPENPAMDHNESFLLAVKCEVITCSSLQSGPMASSALVVEQKHCTLPTRVHVPVLETSKSKKQEFTELEDPAMDHNESFLLAVKSEIIPSLQSGPMASSALVIEQKHCTLPTRVHVPVLETSKSKKQEFTEPEHPTIDHNEVFLPTNNKSVVTSCSKSVLAVGIQMKNCKLPMGPLVQKASGAGQVVKERDQLKRIHTGSAKHPVSAATMQRRAARRSMNSSVNSSVNDSCLGQNRTLNTSARPRIRSVPQTRLVLNRSSAMPKQQLLYASRNMYYDENWMLKQERGFVKWLNFVLTPLDEDTTACQKSKVDIGSITFTFDVEKSDLKPAPTKEAVSLRTYSARRRMNQLRRSACRLFQTDAVVKIVRRTEVEVDTLRLCVRKDKMIHADIGIRQQLLDMLLSYNPLWLRIGLETIFGELLPVQSNTDIIGLSRFILFRLLDNPDIAAEFAHPSVPHLYRPGYQESLSRHILKKFLILVYFLDIAKSSRLIDHNPCLFCKDAEFKSSRSLLLQFSKDLLSGEGDITRHLGYFGYKTTHTQTALDEYDYAVTNLALDLRDGVRLCRVVELILGDWTLTCQIRMPAISRLQKIHNVEVSFKVLKKKGIPLDEKPATSPRDVVDGHREKTLALLWKLILKYQVECLLDEKELTLEINFLNKCYKLKQQIQKFYNRDMQHGLDDAVDGKYGDSDDAGHVYGSKKIQLLLDWCRAVCKHYNMKLENFTVSFGDGRALCYLLHHYHPTLLPLDTIHNNTTITLQNINNTSGADDSFGSPSVLSLGRDGPDQDVFNAMLANEKANFKLVYQKVAELGGVPLMLKSSDMCNTLPDEKVVMTFVTHLCARLLNIREETRAAQTIQLAWRRYRLKGAQEERKIHSKAIVVLQRTVREFLSKRRYKRRHDSAIVLQKWWRQQCFRRELANRVVERRFRAENSAACCIQAYFRGYLTRARLRRMMSMVIQVQALVRGFLARKAVRRWQKAATTIQQRYRAHCLARSTRHEYIQMKNAAVIIKAVWKSHAQRKTCQGIRRAIILIQTAFKGYMARKRYRAQKMAAVKIQQFYRGQVLMKHDRECYCRMRVAALSIQKHYRGSRQRHRYQEVKKATITLQASFRGYSNRVKYQALRSAAVSIQVYYRAHQAMKHAREKYMTMKRAACRIQACWRQYKAHETERFEKGAVVIQSYYRGYKSRFMYQRLLTATVIVQKVIRGYLCRLRYERFRKAIICTQQRYRTKYEARKAQMYFKKCRDAAIRIQTVYRMHRERLAFLKKRTAVMTIQSHLRGALTRRRLLVQRAAVMIVENYYYARIQMRSDRQRYLKKRNAVIAIQRAYRQHRLRKNALESRCATRIQAVYRMYRARKSFIVKRKAAVHIQSHLRGALTRRRLLVQRAAVMIVENYYYARIQMRSDRQRYLKKRNAVIAIQRVYRQHRLRKNALESRCATRIQAVYRMYRARKSFIVKRKAAVHIQSHLRGALTRRRLLVQRAAVMIVENYYYARIQMKRDRHRYLKKQNAAVAIQRACRQHRLRKNALELRCATRIQAVYRMYHARKSFIMKRKAAVIIQSRMKGILARKRLLFLRAAVVIIENIYYARKQMKLARVSYLKKRAAVITIQRTYKQCRLRKAAYESRCATRIQACVRSWLVRRKYCDTRCKVITIQSHVRGYCVRKHYLSMKKAVTVLQVRYRAKLAGKSAREGYTRTQSAIQILQAAYRGHQCRKVLKRQHAMAVMLQACWKGYQQRKDYACLKHAAVIIQRYFRSRREMEQVRGVYVNKRRACIILQRAWRERALSKVEKREQAATYIQAIFRGYQIRKKFLSQKLSAIILQKFWRMYSQRKKFATQRAACVMLQRQFHVRETRRTFLICKMAAICIQSWTRGCLERKRLAKAQIAATKIAATYKMFCECRRYQGLRSSAVTVQRVYRRRNIAQRQRVQYLRLKNAAIMIQACTRAYQARRRYSLQQRGFTKLQSAIRSYFQRMRWLHDYHAIVQLQRRWRATLLMRQERNRYRKTIQAVLTIQTAYRWHLISAEIEKENAAIKIQAAFRRFIVHRWYHDIRARVILLQACFRGMVQRVHYHRIQTATVILQVRWRATLHAKACRLNYQRLLRSAVTIQTCYRGYRARSGIAQDKANVIKVQALVRGQSCLRRYQEQRTAAIHVQRWFRNVSECRKLQADFINKRCAVVKIQAYLRGCQHRRKYLDTRSKVIRLQAYVRGILQRKRYHALQKAAVCIQRKWRTMLAARKYRAHYQQILQSAVLIQAWYRGQKARRAFKRTTTSVIQCQALVRGYLVRSRCHKDQLAAASIQQWYRSIQETRRLKATYAEKKSAIIKLQRWFRSCHERKLFLEARCQVIHAQAIVRGYLVRLHLQKQHTAATVIQHWHRNIQESRRVRREFVLLKQATITIQAFYRGCLGRRLVIKHCCARLIQTTYRMYHHRKAYVQQKRAALVVQSVYRGHVAKKRYHILRESVKRIQQYIREYLFWRRLEMLLQHRRQAAVKIQTCYRGYLARKCLLREKSARSIQAMFRGHCQRCRYRQIQVSVRCIQSVARGYLTRRRFQSMVHRHRAAMCIQKHVRGFQARRRVKAYHRFQSERLLRLTSHTQRHLAVVSIQRCYRRHRALEQAKQQLDKVIFIQRWWRSKQTLLHYHRMQHSVCKIQHCVRAWLVRRYNSARTIQQAVKQWLSRRRLMKQETSAARIQALWRGYRVRKTTHSRKLTKLRARINEANRVAAPENTLGYRTTSALDYLLRYRDLSYILQALIHLDVSTRLSPRCCERMVEMNAVCVLYRLMRSCNRSLPHMELIRYSIRVLLNLTKYERTRDAVFDVPGSVSTLTELLQIYREKGTIFTQTCTLLGILSLDIDRRMEIEKDIKETERIRSIHQLTSRKHKIDEARLIVKTKLEMSRTTFNSTLPLSTPTKCARVRPQWMLHRDSMSDIEDPLQAINFVMDSLKLKPKFK